MPHAIIKADGPCGVRGFTPHGPDTTLQKQGGKVMASWEYRVAYVDFRGRVSIEGQEIFMEKGERRSAFVRAVLDHLGKDGWELAGVHPLWPAETSYMVFKRPATGDSNQNEPKARAESPESALREERPEGGEPTRGIGEDNTELV